MPNWTLQQLESTKAGKVAIEELQRPWEQREIDSLRAACSDPKATVDIIELAQSLGRSHASVAIKISRLGLGSHVRKATDREKEAQSRTMKAQWETLTQEEREKRVAHLMPYIGTNFKGCRHTEEFKKEASIRSKKWLQENEHPKGMLGKNHTEETKRKIRESHKGKKIPREQVLKSMKTRMERYGTLNPPDYRKGASWKAHWVEIGGKRFYARSTWEANYARYLEFLRVAGEVSDWEHEPETFWFDKVKRGCVSYLPDFKVTLWTGDVEYHEVKGWMDARSKTKIKRMAKYFPHISLIVVDAKRYRAISELGSKLIKDWNKSGQTESKA